MTRCGNVQMKTSEQFKRCSHVWYGTESRRRWRLQTQEKLACVKSRVVIVTLKRCQHKANDPETWWRERKWGFFVFAYIYRKNPNARCVERCKAHCWCTWHDWLGSDLDRTFHPLGSHTNSTSNLRKTTPKKQTNIERSHYNCLPPNVIQPCRGLNLHGKWLHETRNSCKLRPWALFTTKIEQLSRLANQHRHSDLTNLEKNSFVTNPLRCWWSSRKSPRRTRRTFSFRFFARKYWINLFKRKGLQSAWCRSVNCSLLLSALRPTLLLLTCDLAGCELMACGLVPVGYKVLDSVWSHGPWEELTTKWGKKHSTLFLRLFLLFCISASNVFLNTFF